MPELPEVETVARDLKPLLLGKTIRDAWWSGKKLRLPWQEDWTGYVHGWSFQDVQRRAKWLVFYLGKANSAAGGKSETHNPKLIAHLGMTGQLTVVQGEGLEGQPPLRRDHVHLRFDLTGPSSPAGMTAAKKGNGLLKPQILRFRDIRRFGGIHLVKNEGELEAFFERHRLGPEPWDCSLRVWKLALSRTDRAIKVVLLDQSVISGVGNIYADESLHAAGVHPCRTASSLGHDEASRLLKQAAEVMRKAIENRGSTIRDYVGGENLNGRNQEFLRVYGREGQPCSTCGAKLLRWTVGGRSSHFCPKCQPVPRGMGRGRIGRGGGC